MTTALVSIAVLYPLWALTFSGGAPARRTGAPGERTCNSSNCHDAFPTNSGSGAVALSLPEAVLPASIVPVGVSVTGQTARYGFQITAVDSQNNPVGTWTPDFSTEFAGTSTAHVTHSAPSLVGTWTIDWTAPDAAIGPVTFYAAGVEADGQNGNQGDHVYTTSASLNVAQDVATQAQDLPEDVIALTVFPNHFRNHLTIRYETVQVQPVAVTLFDVQGREVKALPRRMHGAGVHRINWAGATLPPGRYILRVQTPRGTHTHLITKR